MGGDYSKFVESVTNEIQFLKKCNQYNSPFILKFYEYWIEGNFAYIITEMCDDNLRNRINTVHLSKSKHDASSPIENKNKNSEFTKQELEALDLIFQVTIGRKHIFELNIIHRDLKPENILIKNGIVKIADFGAAKRDTSVLTFAGTSLYLAPEFMNTKAETRNYKVDIWSIGCI